VHAHAAVVVQPSGDGCAYSTLRSDPPLLLRPTPGGLYLQGGAAGPLGGDQLRFDVHVTAGARLTIRSVAATIVLPGHGPSCLDISVRVDDGAHLDWQPEPLVSVAGSRHRQRVDIEIAPSATLRWCERLVLGRSGEPPGDLVSEIRAERCGTVVLHQGQRIGAPDERDTWRNAAVVGDGRVVATELVVGGTVTPTVRHDPDTGTRAARMALASDVWLTQAVGTEPRAVDALLA
jgi:urease accessory protein